MLQQILQMAENVENKRIIKDSFRFIVLQGSLHFSFNELKSHHGRTGFNIIFLKTQLIDI